MKFSIKNFFSKCEQITQFPLDLVRFAEEILHEKLHFLCSVTFITVLPLSFAITLLCSSPPSKKSSDESSHEDYPQLLKRFPKISEAATRGVL